MDNGSMMRMGHLYLVKVIIEDLIHAIRLQRLVNEFARSNQYSSFTVADFTAISSSDTEWNKNERVNDGDIHFGSWIPNNSKGYLTISLGSELWVQRIKVRTGYLEEGFDRVKVKAGNDECGVQAGNMELPAPDTWIHYRCPEPGVFTNTIEISSRVGDAGKISVTEVIVADCPNGFKRLDNLAVHCYKILAPAPFGNQSRQCQRLSGNIMTTNGDDDNHFIIRKIMELMSLSTVFLSTSCIINRYLQIGQIMYSSFFRSNSFKMDISR